MQFKFIFNKNNILKKMHKVTKKLYLSYWKIYSSVLNCYVLFTWNKLYFKNKITVVLRYVAGNNTCHWNKTDVWYKMSSLSYLATQNSMYRTNSSIWKKAWDIFILLCISVYCIYLNKTCHYFTLTFPYHKIEINDS